MKETVHQRDGSGGQVSKTLELGGSLQTLIISVIKNNVPSFQGSGNCLASICCVRARARRLLFISSFRVNC